MNLEELYKNNFNENYNGYFIDIGALDGIRESNTAILAKMGWGGLMIEPVLESYEKCKDRYKNNEKIKVLNFAVGNSNRTDHIRVFDGDDSLVGVSTLKKEYYNIWNDDTFEYSPKIKGHLEIVQSVTVHTLEEVLNLSDVNKIDVLSIDAEGSEWDILNHFNIKKYSPKIAIIEMHEQSKPWQRYDFIVDMNKKINDYFSKNKYEKVYSDELNNIYIKNE